jgi:hypothetical protein
MEHITNCKLSTKGEKMKKVLTIVTIAIIVSSPCLANYFDGGAGAGNPNWNAAANWDDDTVPTPTSGDVQAINVPGYGVVVNNAGAQAQAVNVGIWSWPGTLTVAAAGTLNIAGNLLIANDAGVIGNVLNHGQLTSLGTYMQAGVGSLVNSGTFTSSVLILGNTASSTSTVENTGTMDINGWLNLSLTGSNSVFNMNGGVVETDRLEMPNSGVGHLNLHGGVITNADLGLNGNGDYTIEVGDGEMYSAGDHTGGLDWMIGAGLITGAPGKTPYSSYDGTYTKLAAIPEPATIGLLAILGLAFLRRK